MSPCKPKPGCEPKKPTLGFVAVLASLTLAVAFLAAGCNLWQNAAEKAIEEATNSDIDVSGNGESITINSSEGSMSFGEDIDLPDNFPTDIPIYQGAKTTSAVVSGDGESISASFSTTAALQTVASWYKTELTSEGWTITNTVEYSGVINYSIEKAGREGTVAVSEGSDDLEGQTMISVVIS